LEGKKSNGRRGEKTMKRGKGERNENDGLSQVNLLRREKRNGPIQPKAGYCLRVPKIITINEIYINHSKAADN